MGVTEYTPEVLAWPTSTGAAVVPIQRMEQVQIVVATHFGLHRWQLLCPDQSKSIAFARHVAMYLCKRRLGVSFPEVGRAFGSRHHTTAMSAVRKIARLLDVDLSTVDHVAAIEAELDRTTLR